MVVKYFVATHTLLVSNAANILMESCEKWIRKKEDEQKCIWKLTIILVEKVQWKGGWKENEGAKWKASLKDAVDGKNDTWWWRGLAWCSLDPFRGLGSWGWDGLWISSLQPHDLDFASKISPELSPAQQIAQENAKA